MNNQYIVEMKEISKHFGGIQALSGVNFKLRPNSVHALMGENGAGKSSLMKILLGIYKPDAGQIIFDGKIIELHNPKNALDMGFTMIHQELMQMEELSVADNIFMGKYPGKLTVNRKQIIEKTKQLLKTLKIEGIAADEKMKNLSLAEKQLIEIAKAVSYDAKVIVMDEPTSTLTDSEIKILFDIIKHLREEGRSIVYISHRMEEIFQITDEITVLRDGEYIATDYTKNFTQDRLVQLMIGREIKDIFEKSKANFGEVALQVKGLSSKNAFDNISFDLKYGEILGVSGLLGAGRSEVMETIFGLRKKSSGEIFLKGKKINIRKPKDAINNGIAFVTEDRKKTGLFLELPIRFNISISKLVSLAKSLIVSKRKEKQATHKEARNLGVKTKSIEDSVSSLSGGNQQKVVLAKWMSINPDILILDEPTRGIDIGAKKEIYSLIDRMAKSGKAIICISSEMPELLSIADRIMVMHEGKLKGEILGVEASQERIAELITA